MNEAKRQRRLERKIRTELAWLRHVGLERDNAVPLYAGQAKTNGRYTP